jgi:adenosylcobinamide kinase/adenosylcobinamide-phosphate guanylyltransferase
MRSSNFVFIAGGVRSGKSRFALARAMRLGTRRVLVATAEALDDEMRERIERHRADRGDAFRTVEAPRELAAALLSLTEADVAVIDCLTLWLANRLGVGATPEEVEDEVEELLGVIATRSFSVVLVSNEVGMGIVPETPLGRVFRDVAGRAHQRCTARAGEVYFAVMGCVLRLVPGPITAVGS